MTPKQFDPPINGLYQSVRIMYNTDDFYYDWVFHGVGADSWNVGPDDAGNCSNQPFNNWHIIDSYNGVITRFYNRNYSQIFQCNILLDKIENPSVNWDSETTKNQKRQKFCF